MARIYTKTGDNGTTALIGGERVPKTDVRVEAYGTIDELGAHIALLDGMLRTEKIKHFRDDLLTVAKDLMRLEAIVALDDSATVDEDDFDSENIAWLEELIDNLSENLTEAKSFIVPFGNALIGQCHVCRTVCRRAERRVIQASEMHHIPQVVITYLNRLSDYLFILSRKVSEMTHSEEILWQ